MQCSTLWLRRVVHAECVLHPMPFVCRPSQTPWRRGVSTYSHSNVQKSSIAAHDGEHNGARRTPAPSIDVLGQVVAAQANFVRVRVDAMVDRDGTTPPLTWSDPPPTTELLCVVRALLKKIKQTVLVGDRVRVAGIDWADARGVVDEVFPRTSQLCDPAVANVDHTLLVFTFDMPPFEPANATRYLVAAEATDVPLTVVVNKADIVDHTTSERVLAQIRGWGYHAVPVSTVTGQGIAELTGLLRDKVAVLAGPSGVGKSSIINALRLHAAQQAGAGGPLVLPWQLGSGGQAAEGQASEASDGDEWVDEGTPDPALVAAASALQVDLQSTGGLSQIGRGKHTTRNVSLLQLPGGGLLADTPGFNQPELTMEPTALPDLFPEIRQVLETTRCAFGDCRHLDEPGCAVRGDWERYDYYVALRMELQELADVAKTRAASKRQRQGALRSKMRKGGTVAYEALLNPKSHRRVSRKSAKQQLQLDDLDELD